MSRRMPTTRLRAGGTRRALRSARRCALGLESAEPSVISLGVIGGGDVFGLFLDHYDVFYLSHVPDTRLPGGRPVFPAVPEVAPESVLAAHGLVAAPAEVLDQARAVTLTAWRRAGR